MSQIITAYSLEELAAAVARELLPQLRAQLQREPAEEEELLSGLEASKLFAPAVSPRTIINWTREGLINSYRIGGRVFYKRNEILLAAQKIKRYSKNQSGL